MNDMTEAMLDAQYRDQVERWWSPQALSEIHRLLCTVAPLYRETGEHSAIEMSPKEQVSWMCQEIDRLRAEVERLEAENERLKAERDALLALVRRFREWDHLDNAGDGPYWKITIDNLIARLQDATRKAGEEPLPTIEQMAGSDPNFTGEETTAEYLREIGRTGEDLLA